MIIPVLGRALKKKTIIVKLTISTQTIILLLLLLTSVPFLDRVKASSKIPTIYLRFYQIIKVLKVRAANIRKGTPTSAASKV